MYYIKYKKKGGEKVFISRLLEYEEGMRFAKLLKEGKCGFRVNEIILEREDKEYYERLL